jgi:hypothetical protein
MRRVAALLAEVRGARVAELVTAVLPDMVPLTSLEGVSVTSNVANCAARGSAGAEAPGLGAQSAADVGEDVADLVTHDGQDDDHDDGDENQDERVLHHPLTLLAGRIGVTGGQAKAVARLS